MVHNFKSFCNEIDCFSFPYSFESVVITETIPNDPDGYSDDDDVPFDENQGIIEDDNDSDSHNIPMKFKQMEAHYKPKVVSVVKHSASAKLNVNIDKLRVKGDDDEYVVDDEGDIDEDFEYSDVDENDQDSSDVDDSDLLKRLDEKYGKLPKASAQRIDLDVNDEDDTDGIDPTWTSNFIIYFL